MTYYDASGGERNDRMYIGYEFTDNSIAGINIACNGETPIVAIDLGNTPIELELITGSVTALSQLIDACYEARALLEEHLVDHATKTDTWNQDTVYIPSEWTGEQES
ncbi:hypothetical protein HPO96_28595 [Kribbella sandramycini]|uniref:Uncharacterized protein n=1 Tax=Kribbella sandramycini TaxID=60450 RepID=A0A7Y4L4H4_9ACTN|nr:hypothetical protein [Kribbella sandramycini]MBB6571567.1 hypothetical protein [Kribbella sandramycini]NOL44213.1 hypothetical protein [Kribbella sandramycini]